ILASLGLQTLDDLVGRVDLLRRREGAKSSLALEGLLDAKAAPKGSAATDRANARLKPSRSGLERWSARLQPSVTVPPTLDAPLTLSGSIANTDRAYGADIAGAIAARRGDAGLPDGFVRATVTGSAGQSFGAFSLPGMRLSLVGDANDGLGKGMHGGEI